MKTFDLILGNNKMMNIMIIYTERYNRPFDVFAVTDKEFEIIFPNKIDIGTISEVKEQIDQLLPNENHSDYSCSLYRWLNAIMLRMEYRRIPISQIKGIHATLYMDVDSLSVQIKDRIEDKINYQDKTMLMFDYKDRTVFEHIHGKYDMPGYKYMPYYDPEIDGISGMKNFLFIDLGSPCYCLEVYAVTNEEFNIMFGITDIAMDYEIYQQIEKLNFSEEYKKNIANNIWSRRVPKALAVNGIHGIVLDRSLEICIKYYPTRRIEEAVNPDGTALRPYGATSTQKTALLPYHYIDFDEEDPNLTNEQINDLWDDAIKKIEHNLGVSREDEIVVSYSLTSYNEYNNSDGDV